MKKFIFTLVLLQALLIFSAFGQNGFSQAFEDSLLTLLGEKNKAMGSLALMDKGSMIYSRAIGYASVSPEKVLSTPETKYRIGSISKMFTSTLIFQLIEENKLQLTTTLDRFFPQVPNAGKITIGNLLNHRSGIHNLTSDPAYTSYMTKPKTKSEMVEVMSAFSSDFEPGKKFSYSNSNYILLGYIIEELRKAAYNEVLQKYICSKAGLASTYYGSSTDLSKNETYSYTYDRSWNKSPETDMSIPHGAGAVVSTPTDLLRFITALFDGRLISEESLGTMTTITDGMGMGIMKLPYEDKTIYGHAGGIDGFNSLLLYIPADRLAVSYCSNGTVYSVNDIILRTLNNYYGKNEKLPQFNVYNVNPGDLDKYLGVYSNPAIPIKLTISKNNGRLYGQGTGQPSFPLEATGKDEFRFDPAGIIIYFKPGDNQFEMNQGGRLNTFTREE